MLVAVKKAGISGDDMDEKYTNQNNSESQLSATLSTNGNFYTVFY